MRFTEAETRLLLEALRARAETKRRLEEADTLRQRYAGMTPEGRAHCTRRVDEYRAEREAAEALIARLEYVGCEA